MTSEHSFSLLLQKILTQGFFFSFWRMTTVTRSTGCWFDPIIHLNQLKIQMYYIVVILKYTNKGHNQMRCAHLNLHSVNVLGGE